MLSGLCTADKIALILNAMAIVFFSGAVAFGIVFSFFDIYDERVSRARNICLTIGWILLPISLFIRS